MEDPLFKSSFLFHRIMNYILIQQQDEKSLWHCPPKSIKAQVNIMWSTEVSLKSIKWPENCVEYFQCQQQKVTGVNICYLDQFSNFAVVFIVGFWLKPNFLLRKIFRGNLKEAISLAEIASFRFPWKISHKRKVAIMSRTAIVWKRRGLYLAVGNIVCKTCSIYMFYGIIHLVRVCIRR